MPFWVTAVSFFFFLLFRLKFWVLTSRSIVQKFQNRIHLSASWSSRPLQGLHMFVVLGNVLFIVLSLAVATCVAPHGTYCCPSLLSLRSARTTGTVLVFLIRCLVKWSKRLHIYLVCRLSGCVLLVTLLCVGLCVCVCVCVCVRARAHSLIFLCNFKLQTFTF
jgi:hypothetical protein